MNLKQKMVAGAAIVTIVPVLLTGGLIGVQAVQQSQRALEQGAQDKLTSLMNARKEQIETYLLTMTDQIKTFSNDRMVIEAMTRFKTQFKITPETSRGDLRNYRTTLRNYYKDDFTKEYESRNTSKAPNMEPMLTALDDESLIWQYHYIADNSYPLGQKDKLDFSGDGTEYSRTHMLYHPHFHDYLETFGFYDIFLVDAESGDIVYSVFKELDYSTSLKDGPYASSGLGKAFQEGNKLTQGNEFAIVDYDPYLPSYQDQAMFIASPIFDYGEKLGILIFQAPIDRINALMTSNQTWKQYGLGESGETYLVGDDGFMRNDSRFLIEDKINYLTAIKNSGLSKEVLATIDVKNTSIGLQKVDTPATQAALEGKSGFEVFPDYRQIPVLSAYTPIEVPGLNWALMAEIDEAEAFGPTQALKSQVVQQASIIGFLVLVIGGVVAFFFVRSITHSIYGFEAAVRQVMSGDRDARALADSKDELGQFGSTLNRLLDDHADNLTRTERENEMLNDSIIELLEASIPLRDKDLTTRLPVKEDITGPLASAVNQTTSEIAETLQEVARVADAVERTSTTVKSQSGTVSQAAELERSELIVTLEKLGLAVEAMGRISELGQKCNEMATIASENTENAFNSVNETVTGLTEIRETIHETEKRLKRLGERSQEINATVNIINNIAERTHVLALNASMQAAAAGEEGKAFAVIADEVQRLAESARDATSQISGLVDNIQIETRHATETMNTTVSNVVQGSKVAEVAGQKMNTTREAAEELASAVKQIAGYSFDQVNVSKDLMERARKLQNSAETTHGQLQQQDVETTRLMESAKTLLAAVQQFTLPHVEKPQEVPELRKAG